jgi:hypothetical protein
MLRQIGKYGKLLCFYIQLPDPALGRVTDIKLSCSVKTQALKDIETCRFTRSVNI